MVGKRANSELLHPDRLLPSDPAVCRIARDLLEQISDLPLICPHGHTEAHWYHRDFRFSNASELLLTPDHYLLRLLVSQGVTFADLGVGKGTGGGPIADPRSAWRCFADNYHLFRGTPSRMWLNHALHDVLEVPWALESATADRIYDHINERLESDDCSPRALYTRFGIEMIATTDSATDPLDHHRALATEDWPGRVIPTFRPDAVTDPQRDDFAEQMALLGEQTGRDVGQWRGYLDALRDRREVFRSHGATATDHGVASPQTADLHEATCQRLLTGALRGELSEQECRLFGAQMLTEMARMSAADGLVMQIHAGSWRNHAPSIYRDYGRDRGFDMPMRTDWTGGLKALLDCCGFDPNLKIILYTLDEAAYARDLAPLAGAYPCLTVGAAWWFFDSPLGMRRQLEQVVETAGFCNLAGFVDDTRALPSIPARHDMFRRVAAGYLASLVAEHQINRHEAGKIAEDLAVNLVRKAYRLGGKGVH